MKLMNIISTAVSSLENLEDLMPTLQKLGQVHVTKNVKEEHYDLVGKCLIDTLITALTDKVMTEDVIASWVKTYNILATVMKGDLYK